jgi:hypothetical protein
MSRSASIRLLVLLTLLVSMVLLWPLRGRIQSRVVSATQKPKGQRDKTVADRLMEYGVTARARIKPYFINARLGYPPGKLTFIGIKDEQVLQVYVTSSNQPSKFLRNYAILAASGELGPKLREGDRQVPEGLYRIEWLNPNSSYHLSLRVNYPNEFDRAQASKEGRSNLGGDIMIHGNTVSVGCLAMGDEAAEDLFVLAADVGIENITVVLTPVDFRTKSMPATATNLPVWTDELYDQIKRKLRDYPAPLVSTKPPKS